MNKKRFVALANLGQWLALAILILATVYMIAKRESLTQVLITIASVLFAIVTKIKYYSSRKESRKRIPISALRWVKGRLIYVTEHR